MPDRPTWAYVVLHLGGLAMVLTAFVVLAAAHGLTDSMPEGFIALAGAIIGSSAGAIIGSSAGITGKISAALTGQVAPAAPAAATATAPARLVTPGSLLDRGGAAG